MGQNDGGGQEQLSTRLLRAVPEWLSLCCGSIRMIYILPQAMPPTEIRGKLGYDITQGVHFLKVTALRGCLHEGIRNCKELLVLSVLLDILQG